MSIDHSDVVLPRIAISYCTQCRWMLRAAYFAQELLTTFNTSIGEIALIPTTGGIFTVTLTHYAPSKDLVNNSESSTTGEPSTREPQKVLLWDRKTEGGFPETKVLKQLVRDWIEPDKNLGHSDRSQKPAPSTDAKPQS